MNIKKFLEEKRFYLYPLAILIIVLILSVLRLNTSSVGMYKGYISNNQIVDENVLFGKARAIRSDQYLVTIPLQISQDINKEPIINHDIGEGTNVIAQYVPTRNFTSIFKPTFISFYLSDDTEFSYSLANWLEIGFLLIATYLLLLELTNKNLLISIVGSLIFLFTPFIQWWNNFTPITWASFAIYAFIRIFRTKKIGELLLFGLLFTYSTIAFLIILYPPFQIPLVYICLAIALGFIIKNFAEIKKKKELLKIGITLILSILSVILLAILLIKEIKPVINITMNTTYPGARFINAGLGDKNLLFNGFYNILLQIDSNIAPFANQSESSNFFLFFPPLIIWVIYKNVLSYKKRKEVEWIGMFLSIVLIFFLCIYLLPLPDIISRGTLMYLIPPQRLLIGFGFGSYLLMFYTLGNKFYGKKQNKIETVIIIILSCLFAFLIFALGKNLLSTAPDFFKSPTFINANIKILLSTGFVAISTFTLLQQERKKFLILLSLFAIVSSVAVNPLYKGLDILINTDLANYIKKESSVDDSKWIIYGSHTLAQYALSNNASTINGVHLYPQFKIWEVVDPEKKSVDTYNRYAHIIVSETKEESSVQLVQQDALMLQISPCDSKLKELGVKYVLTDTPLENTSCLIEKMKFNDKIVIYNLE